MGTRTRVGTEPAADGMKQVKARRKRAICSREVKGVEANLGLWIVRDQSPGLKAHGVEMRFPADLVPQKVVADDLCVSIVTLWRARRSGIPGFPEPIVIRNMIFWRKDDVGRLEDALLRFEGRGEFEKRRTGDRRNASLLNSRSKARRQKGLLPSDQRQLDLF